MAVSLSCLCSTKGLPFYAQVWGSLVTEARSGIHSTSLGQGPAVVKAEVVLGCIAKSSYQVSLGMNGHRNKFFGLVYILSLTHNPAGVTWEVTP